MSGDDRRAPSTPEPATSHHRIDTAKRLPENTPLVRKNNSDALFGASTGAYSPSFVLPGEEPPTGAARREVGQTRAGRVEDYGIKARIEAWAKALAPYTRVTVEDARPVLGADVLAPGAWGAIMATLARRGVLRHVGYVKAERPEAHARIIGVYERVS